MKVEKARELFNVGKLAEAETLLRTLDPLDPAVLYLLVNCLVLQARLIEAMQPLTTLAHLDRLPQSHSDLLFYGLHLDPLKFRGAHGRWQERFAPTGTTRPVSDYDGKRRLRIGYLSPNLRKHTVTKFLEPILQNHSHAVEVYVYCDNPHDDVTARLIPHADHWRDVDGLNNRQLYAGIRSDKLDVLLDLTGHLNSGNRQMVVAAWPAPHVVGYIGYPHWTGQIGAYRIGDPITDPWPSEEMVIRLDGCWAFRPSDDAPNVSPSPFLTNGHVTFGSFNRVPKILPPMIDLWHRILDATRGSRLRVLTPGGETNTAIRKMFDERVTLMPMGNEAAYFTAINSVDVALDTFPYNGMTTTADCICQGIPAVSLAGEAAVSRTGASLLTAVGLTRCIAATPDQYVSTATALADDLDALQTLRETLRRRMGLSPLCDGKAVAARLEAALMGIIA